MGFCKNIASIIRPFLPEGSGKPGFYKNRVSRESPSLRPLPGDNHVGLMGNIWRNLRKPSVGFPTGRLTGRISLDEPDSLTGLMSRFLGGLNTLASMFPYEFYGLMDQLVISQPYISQYCEQTVSLGNTGHHLEITASTEERAKTALQAANDFAARCHPWKGGGDGIIAGGLFQAARMGGVCIEWPPEKGLKRVGRGYFIPFKTIKFRRIADGELELCQMQQGTPVPLNLIQTSFHAIKSFRRKPLPDPACDLVAAVARAAAQGG